VIAVMPYAERGERLEVGLDAGAPAGVGAGDRERPGRGASLLARHRKWSQPVGSGAPCRRRLDAIRPSPSTLRPISVTARQPLLQLVRAARRPRRRERGQQLVIFAAAERIVERGAGGGGRHRARPSLRRRSRAVARDRSPAVGTSIMAVAPFPASTPLRRRAVGRRCRRTARAAAPSASSRLRGRSLRRSLPTRRPRRDRQGARERRTALPGAPPRPSQITRSMRPGRGTGRPTTRARTRRTLPHAAEQLHHPRRLHVGRQDQRTHRRARARAQPAMSLTFATIALWPRRARPSAGARSAPPRPGHRS
jgi:hypothetical protein